MYCTLQAIKDLINILSLTGCPEGRYGYGCNYTCDCAHGAACEPYDGECICPVGYWGPRCAESEYWNPSPKPLNFNELHSKNLFQKLNGTCICSAGTTRVPSATSTLSDSTRKCACQCAKKMRGIPTARRC